MMFDLKQMRGEVQREFLKELGDEYNAAETKLNEQEELEEQERVEQKRVAYLQSLNLPEKYEKLVKMTDIEVEELIERTEEMTKCSTSINLFPLLSSV